MTVPFQKLFSIVILAAFSLALAACGGNSLSLIHIYPLGTILRSELGGEV